MEEPGNKPNIVEKLVELAFRAESMENEFKRIEEEVSKSSEKLKTPYRLAWADIGGMQKNKKLYGYLEIGNVPTGDSYIRYRIDEDGNPIKCTEREFSDWLSTKPNITIFENEIKGYRVVTMFCPDNFDSSWNQVIAYATEIYLITKPDGLAILYKWSSSPNLKEAEERHKKAIEVVLDEIKKNRKEQ